MIIFGTKSKVVQGHHVQGAECPDCGNRQFSSFGLLKYFHIFWIPFIPTSREAGMQCAHCKKMLVGKELPKPLKRDIKKAIFNGKNTAPMFAGLILFSALVVMIGISGEQRESNTINTVSCASGKLSKMGWKWTSVGIATIAPPVQTGQYGRVKFPSPVILRVSRFT